MSAEAYPDLGLEHNYCRNDPSIASFGFESYPRRLYDDFGAPHPLPRWYRVTTPAYVQTRTAPWHGMSKAPACGGGTHSAWLPSPPYAWLRYTLGLEVRVAQQEQQAARSKHSKNKQARSRVNLPCYLPPIAGGSLGPSAQLHATATNCLSLRLDTPRWCYVEPESVTEDEDVAWCHRTRRKHGYLHRPTDTVTTGSSTDHGMWDCTSGICVATGSGTIRQDWPACGSASNRSAFRNNNVDGCGWPWGTRGETTHTNGHSPALTSEEALQQAQAEGLTLREADNRTGYLGVYYSNMPQTTKPYEARVNRSGELDEWGLHNSSHLADFATAEEAALAIARNAVEEEWVAHECETRALRKEVRTLSKLASKYE